MYYQLEPDIYGTYGITGEPQLPGFGTSFLTGIRLAEKPPVPLVFQSNFPRAEPPRAMLGLSIPVWSADLVNLLRRVGLDNFECFDAKILGRDPGVEWSGYFAVNILGVVAAANMAKSKFVEIASTPSGAPFAGITELRLDENKARGHDLFRLAENTTTLLASQRVVNALKGTPREGGWGISAIEVEGS